MNLKELETFVQLYRDGSITKASKSLYISPQGISKILKNLESHLECTLFIRTSKGILPTKSGECFFKSAQVILNEHQKLEKELHRIKQEHSSKIEILLAYGILQLITPQCVLQFKMQNPSTDFMYTEYPDRKIEQLFLSGEGDLAFSIAPFPNGLFDVITLKTCNVLMIVNKEHPLSKKEFVTINDLKDEPLYIENSKFSEIILKKCKESNFTPNIVFETSDFSLCYKMVKEKRGITVSVDFIYDNMKNDQLVAIPFSEEDLKWQMCLLTRRSERLSETVKIFIQYVKTYMNKK